MMVYQMTTGDRMKRLLTDVGHFARVLSFDHLECVRTHPPLKNQALLSFVPP